MRNTLIVAAIGLMLLGCQNKNESQDMDASRDAKMSSTEDACPHCAGKQTATADGTCPKCGMKVKS